MRNYPTKTLPLFLALIIIFLPFQSLVIEILDFHTGLSSGLIFWLAHWYEPAIILLLTRFIYLCHSCEGRNLIRSLIKSGMTIKIGSLLIIFGVVSILLISPMTSLGLEGFRFTLFAVLLFLIISLLVKDKVLFRSLIYLYVGLASLVALLAIVERFLPLNYWSNWNIIGADSAFGYGVHKVVTVYQSTSLIGGPNQLATYLLPAFFLTLSSVIPACGARTCPRPDRGAGIQKQLVTGSRIKYGMTQAIKLLFMLALLLAIIFTFSRSAYLGLIVGLAVYAVLSPYRYWLLGLVAIVILGLWFVWQQALATDNRQLIDLFTHGSSQDEHRGALEVSFQEVGRRWQEPELFFLGSGLGTAGPLAVKYGRGIISENWYLQIFFELGLIGLLLWLGLIVALSFDLIGRCQQPVNLGLFLALVSVSAAALFLHTWADNPAMAYTLFILLGLRYETHFD